MSGLPAAHAVVFDLDGTLVDSAHDLADAVNEVLVRRDLPQWPVATIRRWIGEGAERLMERALVGGDTERRPAAEETARAVSEFRAIYLGRCTVHTTLYPGAIEALEAARSAGLPTAILTNKPAAQTAVILRHYGLDRLVDAWFGGDSPFGRKPSPAGLLALAERLGVSSAPPDAVWMVGDSITDVRTAHAARATAVAVRGGYDDASPIDTCQPPPAVMLESLREFAALLGGAAPAADRHRRSGLR